MQECILICCYGQREAELDEYTRTIVVIKKRLAQRHTVIGHRVTP